MVFFSHIKKTLNVLLIRPRQTLGILFPIRYSTSWHHSTLYSLSYWHRVI